MSLLVEQRQGVFTYAEWQISLCDTIWQVMLHSSYKQI